MLILVVFNLIFLIGVGFVASVVTTDSFAMQSRLWSKYALVFKRDHRARSLFKCCNCGFGRRKYPHKLTRPVNTDCNL